MEEYFVAYLVCVAILLPVKNYSEFQFLQNVVDFNSDHNFKTDSLFFLVLLPQFLIYYIWAIPLVCTLTNLHLKIIFLKKRQSDTSVSNKTKKVKEK